MLARKGSGFDCFRRALVPSSAARVDCACLAFSPAHPRRHQSYAFMFDNALFGRSHHPQTIPNDGQDESKQTPFKRMRPGSRCITSSVLACKSENTGEASVPARSPSTQKFLDSIRQSFAADILPEVLKGTAESDGPAMDSPLIVLLAVSGGCDSVALLYAMGQFTDEISDSTKGARIIRTAETTQDEGSSTNAIPCEIHVVHFDHQQRGEESDGDRKFVENLALEAGFVFHWFRWGDDGDKDSEDSFSQDAARNWRRTNLIQLAESLANQKRSCGVILTAHHRDDCDETILLKLLRGAHISNLSGMDTVQRSATADDGVVFAKPMLGVSKVDIEHFLTSQRLTWREDSSNASNKYLRNRVRNELLPLLTDLVGGEDILHKRLESLDEQSRKVKADLLPRAAQYLTDWDSVELDQGVFPIPPNEIFTIVHEQALHTWAESHSEGNLILPYDQVKRVTEQLSLYPQRKKWSLHVGNNWNVRRNGDVLLLEANREDSPIITGEIRTVKSSWDLCQDKRDIGKANVLHKCSFQLLVPSGTRFDDLELKYVGGNQSHSFVPPWRKGRSPIKIKDFLRGQKVPLHKREGTPILCIGDVVVGVYIEEEGIVGNVKGGGKWIIHADYQAAEGNQALTKEGLMEVSLVHLVN